MARDAEIEILLKARDEATRELNKVNQSLRGMEGATKSFRDNFARLGPAVKLGAAGLVVGLGATAFKAVEAASAAEEMRNKFDATFGKSVPAARAELNNFAEIVGRGRGELQSMAADVGAVIKSAGLMEDQAARLSVDLTKLATDVASFTNANDAMVLQAFTRALTGEREALKTYGISITEAEVRAKALEMGITNVGTAMSAADKATVTYQLLIDKTGDAQGDAAKTADSYANQMRRLQGQLNDLQIVLGTAFLPAVTKVVTALNEAVGAIGAFADTFQADQSMWTTAGENIHRLATAYETVEERAQAAIDTFKLAREEALLASLGFDPSQVQLGALEEFDPSRLQAILSIGSDAFVMAQKALANQNITMEYNIDLAGQIADASRRLAVEELKAAEAAAKAAEELRIYNDAMERGQELIREWEREQQALTDGITDLFEAARFAGTEFGQMNLSISEMITRLVRAGVDTRQLERRYRELAKSVNDMDAFWQALIETGTEWSQILQDQTSDIDAQTRAIDRLRKAQQKLVGAQGGTIGGGRIPPAADQILTAAQSLFKNLERTGTLKFLQDQGFVPTDINQSGSAFDEFLEVFTDRVNQVFRELNIPGIDAILRIDRLFKDLAGLQHGGSIRHGGLAMVGEGGPELLRLPRGAEVMPLGAAGGGNVTFVYQQNAPVYGFADFERQVGEAVRNYKIRGGFAGMGILNSEVRR